MNNLSVFIYVLKTMLVAGIFLAYYWLALRNKKFHHYNRFYLLFSMALSCIIPLLNFTWITIEEPVVEGSGQVFNYIISAGKPAGGPVVIGVNWALAFYVLIIAGLLFSLLININKIYRLKRRSTTIKMGSVDFIETDEEDAPFSYLTNLFWKRSISLEQEEGRKILKHELTHIQQKHTVDRLFCQLVCSLLWLNPFFWIIQKELLIIHEFIADEEAIGDSDTESFAKMLLLTQYGNHFLAQPQSFFYSSIKRRLLMLTRSKNIRYSYLRRLIALPLLALAVTVFSLEVNARKEYADIVKKVVAKSDSVPTLKFAKPVANTRTHVPGQVPPKFPGGKEGWQQFLMHKINYDKIVEKGGPPGKYAVKMSFQIDKDGDVRDVKALNDPGYGSKEDAMRVLLSSPKWEPATVNGKKVVYRDKIAITYIVADQ